MYSIEHGAQLKKVSPCQEKMFRTTDYSEYSSLISFYGGLKQLVDFYRVFDGSKNEYVVIYHD